MATNGKIEARITIPTGGWDVQVVEYIGGAPQATVNATIPAGTYYHSSDGSTASTLPEEISAQLSVAFTTITATVDATEAGTGKYTITSDGAAGITAIAITFTDTELGDLLGMADVSGSLSYTGSEQAQALWLPSYGHQKKNGGSGGSARTSDQQSVVNSAGYVYAVQGQSYKTARVSWPMETRAKCWTINEATVNESFETFMVDGIWGSAPWGTVTGPIRFHADADTDATYGTFSALGLGSWDPDELIEHFAGGRWMVELPHLVEVPA